MHATGAVQKSNSASLDGASTKFIVSILCYFTLHIILRTYISDSLDYDEAEQALLAQWLQTGYTEQPPLYTWIQYGLFEIFGRNVFAVSLFKNILLALTYICFFLSSRLVLQDNRKAILATASLILIPQIGWESQRDMTHTTLVVCAAAATLYQTLRTIDNRSFGNYLLLGLVLGTGFLGKSNFGLFLAVIILTLASTSKGRKVLSHRYIVLTLLVIWSLCGQYFIWMYNNQDIVFSATHKFKRALDDYYVAGPVSLAYKMFLFLTPLWFVCLLVFPKGYGLSEKFTFTAHEQFIKRYLLFLFVVLLIVVLVFKVTYVKDRWLQPLLFVAPIFFFSRLTAQQITPKRFRTFLIICLIAALGIYAAFTIRVTGGTYTKSFCRMNYPFTEITRKLKADGFASGLIISNNRFLAGNLVLRFPDSTALIPNYRFEEQENTQKHKQALVVWRADRYKEIPEPLSKFIKNTYNVDIQSYPAEYITTGYKYGRGETVTMAAVQLQL